eukprot:scaffold3884_cov392-Prasinococcus_capsulatus_cf.AAC.17
MRRTCHPHPAPARLRVPLNPGPGCISRHDGRVATSRDRLAWLLAPLSHAAECLTCDPFLSALREACTACREDR